MAAEEIVLLAAGAVRALQTADKKQSHPRRDQNGKSVSIHLKPVNQAIHLQSPITTYSK
jgi:hypothetical protein